MISCGYENKATIVFHKDLLYISYALNIQLQYSRVASYFPQYIFDESFYVSIWIIYVQICTRARSGACEIRLKLTYGCLSNFSFTFY